MEEDECSGDTEVVVLNHDEASEETRTEHGSRRIAAERTSTRHVKSTRNSADTISKDRRGVSFGHLHVREFPVVMGDNPSVQFGGPPIRLQYDEGETEYVMIGIDEYEMGRGDRRTLAELRVPATLRRKWVGSNPSLERQVFRTQCQRRRTAANTDSDEWHFQLERVKRGMLKKFQLNKEPKSEAEHWCQQYKIQRQFAGREPVKSQRRFLLCCQINWRQKKWQRRKKQIQDISIFFV